MTNDLVGVHMDDIYDLAEYILDDVDNGVESVSCISTYDVIKRLFSELLIMAEEYETELEIGEIKISEEDDEILLNIFDNEIYIESIAKCSYAADILYVDAEANCTVLNKCLNKDTCEVYVFGIGCESDCRDCVCYDECENKTPDIQVDFSELERVINKLEKEYREKENREKEESNKKVKNVDKEMESEEDIPGFSFSKYDEHGYSTYSFYSTDVGMVEKMRKEVRELFK